jgi:ABC-type sulfate transport system permease component
MGRLRNTRVVSAITLGTVVALLGVVYYKSTGMNVSSTAELLQSPQVLCAVLLLFCSFPASAAAAHMCLPLSWSLSRARSLSCLLYTNSIFLPA